MKNLTLIISCLCMGIFIGLTEKAATINPKYFLLNAVAFLIFLLIFKSLKKK